MPSPGRILLLPAALLVLCVAAPADAQINFPEQPEPKNAVMTLPVFEFDSGFWVNLHHFLYEQGRLSAKLPLAGGGAKNVNQSETLADLSTLTPAERAAWESAVAYYAATISHDDLQADDEQSEVSEELSLREGCPHLSGPSGSDCQLLQEPELVNALESAAPIYRAHWWREHDRTNRAWIGNVAPLIRQMGEDIADQLVNIFQEKWPAPKIRVDVVWYAGPLGAYATVRPAHLNIASHDPRNQGLYSLEVLFLEASHTLAGGVTFAIQQECKRREMLIPRDLSDALIFYTAGEVVRRTLAQEGASAEYTPYAYRYGLYDHGWSDFVHVLRIYWQPYLDGKVDFDHAIAHVIAGLS